MAERAAPPKRDYIWLAAILLLATILRAVQLDAPLWFDEIVTVQSHLRLPWGEMMRDYSMNHHYLFSLQAKAAAAAFGMENWAVRLPAMLFGVATVAAVWWLARDIARPAVAHLSATLVAMSYHQIWFSQNARGYTELAFWSTLALILYLRGLARPGPGLWIAYGVTLAAAVATHLTGAFFFAAQGLVWLGFLAIRAARGGPLRAVLVWPLAGAAVGVGLLLVFYAPVLPGVMATVGAVSETSGVDVMQEYQNPLWTVFEGVRTALGAAGPLSAAVAVAALAVAASGGVVAARTAPLFPLVVAVHILLTVAILVAIGMRVWPRFFFVDIGLVLVLIVIGVSALARGLARIAGRPGLAPGLFAAGAVLLIAVSALLAGRNYRAPKQDLAGAHAFVEATRGPEERVYSVGYSGPLFTGHFGADWGNLMAPEDFARVMGEPGPLTLVIPFPDRSFRMIPALDEELGTSLQMVRLFPGTLGDGAILILKRD